MAGVAKGSVAATVEDLRAGRFPQFEGITNLVNELRDLTVGLYKTGIALAEATVVFTLARRLFALGVEPAHLESWVSMCPVPHRVGSLTFERMLQFYRGNAPPYDKAE